MAVIGIDPEQPAELRHRRKIRCRIIIQDAPYGTVREHPVGRQTPDASHRPVRSFFALLAGSPGADDRKILPPCDLHIVFCRADLRISLLIIISDLEHSHLRITEFLVFAGKSPDPQARRHAVSVVVADQSPPEVGSWDLFDQFPAAVSVGDHSSLHGGKQNFKVLSPHSEIDSSHRNFQFRSSCAGHAVIHGSCLQVRSLIRCLGRDDALTEGDLISLVRPERVFPQAEGYGYGHL